MLRKSVFYLLIIVVIIHISPDYIHSQTRYVIKLATVVQRGMRWMEILEEMDEEIQSMTNGLLRFNFKPGSMMGDELDFVRLMRSGQIDGAGLTGKGMGDILSESRVLELPFLFNNTEEIDYVYEKLFDYFDQLFREKGFRLLGWAENGPVHIFSNVPIRKQDDLDNVKIWKWQGDLLAESLCDAFKISSVALPIRDVLKALEEKRVDAFYSSPYATTVFQWWGEVKYMTQLPLINGAGVLLIRETYYNNLPAHYQDILKESCRKYLKRLVIETRKDNESAIRTLTNRGITIIPFNDESVTDYYKNLSFDVRTDLVEKLYSQRILDLVLNTLYEFRESKR
ncbi:MAG: hypothetical protein GY863_09850 [bacterium]|nr:hypothetical protein [bacterium]